MAEIDSADYGIAEGAADPSVAPDTDEEARMKDGLHNTPLLSQREREVLQWLKEGKSSWEISVILGITERTVNFHVRNIMGKLNAVSRTQAVAIAVERGVVLNNHDAQSPEPAAEFP